MKVTIDPSHWNPRLEPRNHDICVAYASGRYTTTQIAEYFKLDRRQIARIVQQGGVARTQSEANRVAAPLKRKHRVRI